MLLKDIKQPQDIKHLDIDELYSLAKEIRQKILNTVMETGGHLASSLGAVEIILAMHYCFDCPNDKFVFDVINVMHTNGLRADMSSLIP